MRIHILAAAALFAAAVVALDPSPRHAEAQRCRGGCCGGSCSGGACFGGSCFSGGCANGVCSPMFAPTIVDTPKPAAPAALDGWRRCETDPDTWGYFKAGAQAGAYRTSAGLYWTLANNVYAREPSEPPPDLPREAAAIAAAPKADCPCCGPDGCPCNCPDCKCRKKPAGNPIPKKPKKEEPIAFGDVPPSLNFGLDLDRMHDDEPAYRLNGKASTRAAAFEALRGDDAVPADAKLNRLSIIGTPDKCAAVVADMQSNPTLAAERSKVTVQTYQPDDPMIAGIGAAKGDPSIYLQTPGGKVLARFEAYPGPEKLAGEIRTKDPNYDPSKDPQPLKPTPAPTPAPTPGPAPFDWQKIPGWVLAAVGIAVAAFSKRDPANAIA